MGMKRVLVMVILFGLLAGAAYAADAANPVESQMTALAGGEAGGSPAHYFVFEAQADGTITPVSYQAVRMAAPMYSLSVERLNQALAQPGRNASALVVLLVDAQGRVVYRDLVSISPWLRGEFHSRDGTDSIDGHFIEQESSAFVVRLPQLKAARLVLQDANLSTLASFDLEALIANTPAADTSSAPLLAVTQRLSGSPANRVDLVVMGDGYTALQSADFQADAQAVLDSFFSISPLTEYSNYYNLYTLEIASEESGADHPEYSETCSYYSPHCCGDPEMLEDPLQGLMVDTAFDSQYCAYWVYRLLVASYTKAYAVAGAIPDWDQLILIVNDDTYGGSGYPALAIISTHELAVNIAQHEYGHSFADLADEYDSPYPGYEACSDLPESSTPCEVNVTDISERAQIKWQPWIEESTPIPTPEELSYDGLVGLFEGARYLESGMYRSGNKCLMRALGYPYCQVPTQAMVLRLYEGGWGVPEDGISLIEPGSTQPESTSLKVDYPATITFSAELLSPVGGPPIEITWLDNGLPIAGATGSTLVYTTPVNSAGVHAISLRVKDVTALVHPLMAGDTLVEEYTWLVEVAPTNLSTLLLPLMWK